MDRLLVLRLHSSGIAAEALLNGIPLARTPAGGGSVLMPVHEYTLSRVNRLELVVEPDAPVNDPRLADVAPFASLRLLLPRVGHVASELHARTLAHLDWAAVEGEPFRVPQKVEREVDIPVAFPRWRWLDAPVVEVTPALAEPIARFLQEIALGLARGDAEVFLSSARVRFEELALAYQRPLADDLARWRARVQLLQAQKALRPPLPTAATLRMRSCAGGRLIECLGVDGLPALRCARPDGSLMWWPVRVAAVDGRFYALR